MAEPTTRLFLAAPHGLDAAAVSCLEAACGAGDVACVLLRAGEDGAHDEALARALVEAAQARGVAVLLENDAALAKALGADGAHVTGGAQAAKAARALLGEEAIVGSECRGKRHEAMELGLAEVDYLALDQRLEAGGENMLDWWVEMFVVPVVALHPVTPAQAAELVRRGADFVCPDAAMWTGPQEAARAISAIMDAIGEGEQA